MRQAINLGALSLLNIISGFLFQWYLFTTLGPGAESDSFFAAYTLPQLILTVISGSLMHVLVPLLSGEREEDLRRNSWDLLFVIVVIFGFLAVLLFITSHWWISAIVPGFSESGKKLTTELARIQLLTMLLTAVNGLQWAAYHAQQRFFWTEISQLICGLLALGFLVVLLPKYGVLAAAWLSVARVGLQAVILMPIMGRPKRPRVNSPVIKTAWIQIRPLLMGNAYFKSDLLIDRLLLSYASNGSISLYNLAQQLYGAVGQVLNKAIAVPMVPVLSRLWKKGDYLEFASVYKRRLVQSILVSLLAILIFVAIGDRLIAVLFGYGAFRGEDESKLWEVMLWLSVYFLSSIGGQITSTAFYSAGDTKTPTKISMINFTAYVPFKIISYWHFGLAGLALSVSIYFAFNLCVQILISFRKGLLVL